METIRADLLGKVSDVFRFQWTERDGDVVPSDDSLKLTNDAVKIVGTVLYADLSESTTLVDDHEPTFAAEIYKAFLHCAARIIQSEGGVVTAYDGDRVMAVYVGKTKNTSAIRAALKLNWAVREIINPAIGSGSV